MLQSILVVGQVIFKVVKVLFQLIVVVTELIFTILKESHHQLKVVVVHPVVLIVEVQAENVRFVVVVKSIVEELDQKVNVELHNIRLLTPVPLQKKEAIAEIVFQLKSSVQAINVIFLDDMLALSRNVHHHQTQLKTILVTTVCPAKLTFFHVVVAKKFSVQFEKFNWSQVVVTKIKLQYIFNTWAVCDSVNFFVAVFVTVKSKQFIVAVIVTVKTQVAEASLKKTLSEDVGTEAPQAHQVVALQCVVVVASQLPVHHTQYLSIFKFLKLFLCNSYTIPDSGSSIIYKSYY